MRVWGTRLQDVSPHRVREFSGWLSGEERRDLEGSMSWRIYLTRVVARGLLRLNLSEALSVPPREIALSRDTGGRLILSGPGGCGEGGVGFSLSHSGDSVACVSRRGRRVGIDLEIKGRPLPTRRKIGYFLSSRESSFLQDGPSEIREDRFLQLWTRKESYLKAVGTGWKSLPTSVTVESPEFQSDDRAGGRDYERGSPWANGRVAEREVEGRMWAFSTWEIFPGTVASLASEGRFGDPPEITLLTN